MSRHGTVINELLLLVGTDQSIGKRVDADLDGINMCVKSLPGIQPDHDICA